MATAKLVIKNAQIVSFTDRYFDTVSPDGKNYKGNGWVVTITPSKIVCHAERNYSDGKAICHREFRLEDGLLGLAGGNIHDRYCYFRTARFQAFLDRFGITAVKKEDPNQKFSGFSNYSGWGTASQDVWSDGKVERTFEPRAGWEEPIEGKSYLYSGHVTHRITGATWAIVERKEDYCDNHNYSRILITLERDVMRLEDSLLAHPEIRKQAIAREQSEALNALEGRTVRNVADLNGLIGEIRTIAPKMEKVFEDLTIVTYMDGLREGGAREFRVTAWGPMRDDSFEFRLIGLRDDGVIGQKVVASGFLG